MATVDLQSTNESGMLYYDHQLIKGQLDGLDTSDSINDKLNTQQTYTDNYGLLGEIRQIALSITGALTKSQLQAKGWAICDGTTATAQGISSAIIENTPDLREKFLRHSADETTGGTGGSATKDLSHTHSYSGGTRGVSNSDNNLYSATNGGLSSSGIVNIGIGSSGSTTQDILPPYYDICYFIKVK